MDKQLDVVLIQTPDHRPLAVAANWLREASKEEFSNLSIKFAQEYAQLECPCNDDPCDDFMRIVKIALKIREAIGQPPIDSRQLELFKIEHTKNGSSKYELMLNYLSKVLHTIAPILTAVQYKTLLFDMYAAKYGGNRVRIKKMPGHQKKTAAKGLTIKEIQEKLGVSRTYAYKLYRKVNKTAKK